MKTKTTTIYFNLLNQQGILEPHSAELSEREIKIFSYVPKGLTNKEIGKEMSISFHTVKLHLSIISQKLFTSKRIRLAIIAYKNGLCEVEY